MYVVQPFYDRQDEQRRLRRFLDGDGGRLAVVYGRRRCGKSALLRTVCGPDDIYFQADEREASLQVAALAAEVDRVVVGFAAARYPSWDALLTSLMARRGRIRLLIDEFPYLVATCPELPSILQRHLDDPRNGHVRVVLCGSSHRMMHGLAMDRASPLYGRAVEVLRIGPLPAGWIADALSIDAEQAVAAWSIWGGIPRYWELAQPYASLEEAVLDLAMHPNGVLHDEPRGLLRDDLRTATQAASILALVGSGCHRLSEIASRLGRPAGALTRSLALLVELGFVEREVPFEADARGGKRTLYRLHDPFVGFWYRFVDPNRSLLQRGLLAPVMERVRPMFSQHTASAWETLARASVPHLPIGGMSWGVAARWWERTGPGFDVVAASTDGRAILVGEARWTRQADLGRWRADLAARAAAAPFVQGRRVVTALFVRSGPHEADLVGPDAVLSALR